MIQTHPFAFTCRDIFHSFCKRTNTKVWSNLIKPRFYGEALTLDEVFERVEEEEKEKEKSSHPMSKQKKATTKQSCKGKPKVAAKKMSAKNLFLQRSEGCEELSPNQL